MLIIPEKTAVICNPECRTQDTSIQQAELRALPSENHRINRLAKEANNSPKAAYDFALRHFRGDGVIRDPYKSIIWMRSSAERGDVNAQKALGRFYLTGLTGLEEMGSDPQEAQSWLAAAAAQGDKESEQLLEEANAAPKNPSTARCIAGDHAFIARGSTTSPITAHGTCHYWYCR